MRLSRVPGIVLMVAACAAGPSGNGRTTPASRQVLSAAEILQSSGATAYDVIAQLRPEFLRSRGAASLRDREPPTAVVYLDNVRMGGLESLRRLSADALLRVEYLGAADATMRFGTDHTGGAILVSTKR